MNKIRELTEDHIDKISKSCQGMHKGNKHASKVIYQFDMEGNFIREFDSVTNAAKSIGRAVSSISLCALGLVRHSGGFKWRYDK